MAFPLTFSAERRRDLFIRSVLLLRTVSTDRAKHINGDTTQDGKPGRIMPSEVIDLMCSREGFRACGRFRRLAPA
jgi:hypothetical protein